MLLGDDEKKPAEDEDREREEAERRRRMVEREPAQIVETGDEDE